MNELTRTTTEISTELFTRWIAYIDASPKTVASYTRSIRQFANWLAANEIAQPSREDIISYRDSLKGTHRPATVAAYMAAVKLFFQWTATEGLYPNIAEHIKGAKVDAGHKKDYLSAGQANYLLKTIDTSNEAGKRDYAMMAIMLTTGLRTISIIRADVDDLQGDKLYYQGKGHDEKADYVRLSPPVAHALQIYLDARHAQHGQPLFTSVAHRNAGGRMDTRSISRIAKDALVSAGMNSDRLTAHSLRHTAATLNLLNGGTLEETRQLLGHSNINTTLIYAHALEREQNQSEQRISNAIFG